MGKIEDIERQLQALSSDELAEFRAWFLEFDWAVWDRQIERDVQAGRLDALAEKATPLGFRVRVTRERTDGTRVWPK